MEKMVTTARVVAVAAVEKAAQTTVQVTDLPAAVAAAVAADQA